jgi:hypothetical protein
MHEQVSVSSALRTVVSSPCPRARSSTSGVRGGMQSRSRGGPVKTTLINPPPVFSPDTPGHLQGDLPLLHVHRGLGVHDQRVASALPPAEGEEAEGERVVDLLRTRALLGYRQAGQAESARLLIWPSSSERSVRLLLASSILSPSRPARPRNGAQRACPEQPSSLLVLSPHLSGR